MTRSDVGRGHPEYYQDLAERDRPPKPPTAYYVNQFNNPANPLAHETTTGPGDLGANRASARRRGLRRRIGGNDHRAEPLFCPRGPARRNGAGRSGRLDAGRLCADRQIGEAGSWLVEGIGEDFMPPMADLSRVRKAYPISRRRSLNTARELLSKRACWSAPRRARCWPPPCAIAASKPAQARGHVRLRFGQ